MDTLLQLPRCCTSVATVLQEGLIINMGSVAALEPMKSTPVYAASKWGIRGWSLSCYDALRQHNVKVVCIHPGITQSYSCWLEVVITYSLVLLPHTTTCACHDVQSSLSCHACSRIAPVRDMHWQMLHGTCLRFMFVVQLL